MNDLELKRTYYFSDCFGDGNGDPLSSPDPDALICTDFRSNPLEPHYREFDDFGREGITDHVLRSVLRLHLEIEASKTLSPDQKRQAGATGLLINSAPRTAPENNGDLFYLATLIGGRIRVVAPLSGLSAVRADVEELAFLPNTDNPLYGPREQFRSSFVGRLLHPDHAIPLERVDYNTIPDFPPGWKVSYVDRFGNMVTYGRSLSLPDGAFSLEIAGVTRPVVRSSSLGEGQPGDILAYQNDGNTEVIRKWRLGESHTERLSASAFVRFGKPAIGAPVSLGA